MDDAGAAFGRADEDGHGKGWFDPEATTFGDRLAGAREAAGLDQGEIARRLGVKVGVLRAWEEDRKEPRANRVAVLAGILGVPLVWLLTGEGSAGGAHRDDDADTLLRDVVAARQDAERLARRLRAIEARLVPGTVDAA